MYIYQAGGQGGYLSCCSGLECGLCLVSSASAKSDVQIVQRSYTSFRHVLEVCDTFCLTAYVVDNAPTPELVDCNAIST
eukprot:6195435-Amphidinium_carterae.1